MNDLYFIRVYEYIGDDTMHFNVSTTQRTIDRIYSRPFKLSESLSILSLIYTNPQDIGD